MALAYLLRAPHFVMSIELYTSIREATSASVSFEALFSEIFLRDYSV